MCVRACAELIVLMCYCALGGVRTWEGLVRVIALSLKECLSVFKPVQHAARQSLLKRHNDAQQHPRGIPQTHTQHTQKLKEHSQTQTFLICIPCFLPRSSVHNKVHLFSIGRRTIRCLFFFFVQRASQFSPSLSISCIHVPLFLYLLPAFQ